MNKKYRWDLPGWIHKLAGREFLGQACLPTSPCVLALTLADLTGRSVDAIVNAADWTMLGGTGVDGAIHALAGPELGRMIVAQNLRLETAGVVHTPGFLLKAQHILHTCAPTYAPGADARAALALCYTRCVARADSMGLVSISFPLLGAGAFGWPLEAATQICAQALRSAARGCRNVQLIEVCAFGPKAAALLETAFGLPCNREVSQDELRYHPGASALSGLSADEISRRF